jgi:uncharacterized protein YkwD
MKKAVAILLFFLMPTLSFSQEKPAKNLDWLVKHPVIVSMQTLQNAERARYQLPALKMNPGLCLIAQKHAVLLAENGWFYHQNQYAEILHQGVISPEDCVNGWIWSPAHHGLMLSGYTEAGFGYMTGPWGSRWVTIFK